jgi:hypothetical protein
MALPGSFPAWLAAPGQADALVYNAAGYNAATAQGYVYPTSAGTPSHPVTPSQRVSAQLTVVQASFTAEQDDGRPLGARR